MNEIIISLKDLAATEGLAKKLSTRVKNGDVLALEGMLGAGKTAFARALLQALGVVGDVPSPTFTLLQIYELPTFTAYHFDLYRLQNSEELDELGWDDALSDGLALVEWPERAESRMPADALVLRFAREGESRTCVIIPRGAWIDRLQGFS